MYKGYRIVCITPAGREKYLSIFKKHIYRKMEEGLVDEWQLWENSVNPSDLAYLESMAAENPRVKIYRIEEPLNLDSGQPAWNSLRTHKFFKFAQDDDAIYIRFDDDIVWAEEDAILRIVQARIDHPEAFIIYPNIINSTICTSWHQEIGALSEEAGIVKKERPDDPDFAYLDAFNYSDSGIIDLIHKTFKRRYEEKSLSAYYLPSKSFDDYKHFSICSICWWGKDHIECGRIEEPQMSYELPKKYGRPVWFCGNALLFHASYHTQIEYLEKVRQPYYLDFFREITN
jgi:hypothetical protein